MPFSLPQGDEQDGEACEAKRQRRRGFSRRSRLLEKIIARDLRRLRLSSALRSKKTLPAVVLIVLLVITATVAIPRTPTPILKIYVWRGYADPTVIAEFESKKCQCYVSVKYMETSDDLYRDLAEKEEYDLISASSDIAGDLVSAGLVIPLPKKLVEGLNLKDPIGNPNPEVTAGGHTYAVPFMWGPNVLIYNTDIFPTAPESWNILREREYRGRVAVWDDLSGLYLAALSDNPQANVYGQEDFRGACRWLPNFGDHDFKLWSDEPDLVAMFRTKQVVAAMGWPLATHELKQLGLPISDTIPREKTTGWVDYLMIPKSSKHVDLAYKLIEYLSERGAQQRIARITHTHPASTSAPYDLTDDERKTWTSDNIKFWRALGKDRKLYISVWEGWKRNECPPKLPAGG